MAAAASQSVLTISESDDPFKRFLIPLLVREAHRRRLNKKRRRHNAWQCFLCYPVHCPLLQRSRKQHGHQRRDVGESVGSSLHQKTRTPDQSIGYTTIPRYHIVWTVSTTWELHVTRWPLRKAPVIRGPRDQNNPENVNLLWVRLHEDLRRLWLQLHHLPRKEGKWRRVWFTRSCSRLGQNSNQREVVGSYPQQRFSSVKLFRGKYYKTFRYTVKWSDGVLEYLKHKDILPMIVKN